MLMCYAFTPNSVFKSGLPKWLRTYLTSQYVILRHCSPNLCKWNYLHCTLPFYKFQVNHFIARDDLSGVKIIPKYILWMRGLVPFWVLRHSFLSLTDWVSEWVKSLSCVRLFETSWTVAYQALLSMGFSRQEYWSGLPLPSPYSH